MIWSAYTAAPSPPHEPRVAAAYIIHPPVMHCVNYNTHHATVRGSKLCNRGYCMHLNVGVNSKLLPNQTTKKLMCRAIIAAHGPSPAAGC